MFASGALRGLWVGAAIAAGGCSAEPPRPAHPPLLIFAAASLKTAFDTLQPLIPRAVGITPQFSYGASSTLARQIEAGAPASVFVSADEEWMDYLAERRLIDPTTRTTLFGNRLVLVAPAAAPLTLRIGPGMPLAAALGAGRLAVADPSHVPAGRYARAALTTLGVWEDVRNRIAAAENARAALLLVARGEAPLGIVYRTDAAAETHVTVVDTFPESTHPPIRYPTAVTARANAALASRFIGYLLADEARAVFAAGGFVLDERAR